MAERLTADQLAEAGRAAFGERWQSSLAEVLAVDSSRIRGVLAGRRQAPPGWTDEVLALLERREAECRAAAKALKERQAIKARILGLDEE